MQTIQKEITNLLSLDNLLPEEREEIILRVGALIYQNIMTRALEIMSEADQDEFEKMLDAQSGPEEIFVFLKNKVPNFEEIMKEEAEKFKNKATGIMDQIG